MYVSFGRRVVSGLLAALMTVSISLTSAFAARLPGVDTQTVHSGQAAGTSMLSILQESLTPQDRSLDIMVRQSPASGILRVIQMEPGETYDSTRLNSYPSLSAVILADTLSEGVNTVPLSTQATVGKQVVAVLRDSSGEAIVDFLSNAVPVDGKGESGGSVLDHCAVTMVKDGSFEENDDSVQVQVKLDPSVESCYLTIFSYAGNTAFDPDATFNKRLWSGRVYDGDEITCAFSPSALPLLPGYKVIACLNVPVGDDNYRSVVSRAIDVVDENGEGFEDYVYPDATIDETELEVGATSLHLSLTGDERLFQAAREGKISITCAVAQYPADESFDFEGDYMISLLNNYQAQEAFSGKEIQFPATPLRAGYRVRAVVYWSQNVELFLPKGNDYEAMFNRPDDSVLIPAVPTAPTLEIRDSVKAGAESVQVAVGGDLPEDSVLILQRFPKGEAFVWQGNGEFIANRAGLVSGQTHTVTIPESSQDKLDPAYQLIAVLLSGGQVAAQSAPVEILPAETLDPFVLEPVGSLLAGAAEAVFRVQYDASITSGRLILCKAVAGGGPDSDQQIASVSLTQGDRISIPIPEGRLRAGDTVYACIYYLQPGTGDFYKNFYSEPLTVVSAVADSVAILEQSLTPSSRSATVVVNGCADFTGGRLILAAGTPGSDADSRRQIYSQKLEGAGTYVCTFSSGVALKAGQDVLPYLYFYDADSDRTLYRYGDPVSVIADGGETVEPKLEIATSALHVGDESMWVVTQFDNALTGLLSVYSYEGTELQPGSGENVLLYQGAAVPSKDASRVMFDRGALPLVEGRRVAAVLTLSDAQETTLHSNFLTVQAAPVIPDPVVTINEKEITEGDTKVRISVSFDRNTVDSARYTAYLFEEDALDKEAETTKILSSNTVYNTTNAYVNFNSAHRPLKVGAHIQVVLSVTDNSGVIKEYGSNVLTVDAAPNWGTPTAAFEDSAVRVDADSVPAAILYDEGYLGMEDYYCNVSIYQFPAGYTDTEFADQELFENPKIAVKVGDLNSTVDRIVRGQVEIPIRSDAVLQEGSRLILKLRLPHTEWEGEEVDYFSASVPVVGTGTEILAPRVLLYHLGPDSSRGERLRAILGELNIETVTIQKSQLNETVGYLAGLEGFASADDPYTGDGYETEFILMSNLGEALLDRFLAAMQAENLRINHKAVVTEYNRYWTMKELIGEIGEEHDVFQALLDLDRLIAKAEDLQRTDYPQADWEAFQSVLDAAGGALSSVEPTLEQLQTALDNLTRAYLSVTGQKELTGRIAIQLTQAADGTYTLSAQVLDGSEGAVFQYLWSSGSTEASISGIPADRLATVTVQATADRFFGTLNAQLKTPDPIQGATAAAGNGQITLQWTAPVQQENQPLVTAYTAALYSAGGELLRDMTAEGSATRMTIQGLQNGTVYTVKLYAVNPVGRSDRLVLTASPAAQNAGGSSKSTSSSAAQPNLYGAAGIAFAIPLTGTERVITGEQAVSDTTADFVMKAGSAYCFKITVVNSTETPSFTVGNSGVLKTQFVAKIGNDSYFRVYAVGEAGQSTGVYTALAGQTPVRHCAVRIAA